MNLGSGQPNIIGNVDDPIGMKVAASVAFPDSDNEAERNQQDNEAMDGYRDITPSLKRMTTRDKSKTRKTTKN